MMPDSTLADIADALRAGRVRSLDLVEECIRRYEALDPHLQAYKLFDAEGAREAAAAADARIVAARGGGEPLPPLCGVPVSVKDLYGVRGYPTFAGTPQELPARWSEDAWLVARLRDQGAVFTGKTHTVELAYGGVGINPHWGTPRNPWDAEVHRVPGGSSAGAGVSLWEGSALLALGSDTGGSIRIPASMTGTVGHRTTWDRWPTDGVVPLSRSLDTVGALTRSVDDAIYFFGSVDPHWGDPQQLLWQLSALVQAGLRIGVPRSTVWSRCQDDIRAVLEDALDELMGVGWTRTEVDGELLDEAGALYLSGAISGAECRAFLEAELPGWLEILHPIVGRRIGAAPPLESDAYRDAVARRNELVARVGELFADVDVLVLPTAIRTPAAVADLEDFEAYADFNRATLIPTAPASMLGLCALTLPVGRDAAGLPVGLQLVGPAGSDETLLGAGLAVERTLGSALERLGPPPLPAP